VNTVTRIVRSLDGGPVVRRFPAPDRLRHVVPQLRLFAEHHSDQPMKRSLDGVEEDRAGEAVVVMGPDLRTVFALYEFEEMSMTEIAGVLRIPRSTVASRLRRGRANFRQRVRSL